MKEYYSYNLFRSLHPNFVTTTIPRAAPVATNYWYKGRNKVGMLPRSLSYKIVYVLVAYLLVVCQPSFAESICVARFNSIPKQKHAKELWTLLNKEAHNGNEIIEVFSQNPEFKKLFESSAGVWEGYTIQEHTLMVFNVFAEQYVRYQRHYQFRVPPEVRIYQVFKFIIALHDIGKPYAIEAGDKTRQLEFTMPILEKALLDYGFSEKEIKIATALVSTEVLGELVKGNIGPREAKPKLIQAARKAEIPVEDYIPLQFLFYTIDASSYPMLYKSVFKTIDQGLLIPKHDQFQSLLNVLTHE